MEFLKGILRSVSFHIGKIIVYVLIALLLTFALRSRNVKALTINDSYDSISDNYLKVLVNTFKTSNYKYYFIATNYDSSVSYRSNTYYLCMNNEVDIDSIGINNASVSCASMYSYSYNNGYVLSRVNDNTLNLNNSIYYTNYYDEQDLTFSDALKFTGVVGIWVFAFVFIFTSIKPTGRGFKYEDI